jgi:hypothetical protein
VLDWLSVDSMLTVRWMLIVRRGRENRWFEEQLRNVPQQ